METRGKIVALCCYIGLLVAPIIIHLTNLNETNQTENRQLASLPTWPDDVGGFQVYSEQFNAYLDDHFGMRSRYIKTANRIKYHLFNELVSKQITVGKNGYIFFNSHSASNKDSLLRSACGVNTVSSSYQEQVESGYAFYLDYLASHGVSASLAIIPIKARIYPEMLPERERRWCDNDNPTWIDDMLVSLSSKGYSIYHPLSFMRQLKNEFQVYLPSFFHWHGKTPKVLAIDMLNKLWHIKASRFDVVGNYLKIGSDLRSHLAGIKLWNDSWYYDYRIAGVTSCTNGRCLPELDRFYQNQSLAYTHESDQANEKVLVITSDSFGAYAAAHFTRGFNRVIQIDLSGIDKEQILPFYEYLFTQFKPTHFLSLIHEGGVWGAGVTNQKLAEQLNQQP